MGKRFLSLIIFVVTFVAGSVAQPSFVPPFDFALFLSGNFAELRSNHFHAGLDFKTQGVSGKPIKAVADGYVSRVRVSWGGYGRALYVMHDNGYMSVYGHLDRFPDDIEEKVRRLQYEKEEYAVDFSLAPDEHRVKQGETLAYAGNSGYSFGPHLHFELRSPDGEQLYNPMLFYKNYVRDTRAPQVKAVAVYPVAGVVEGACESLVRKVSAAASPDTLSAWGVLGFGLQSLDYMDGTHNKYGVYSTELYVDDSLRFSSRADNFSYSENRLINAWADYERLDAGKGWFMRSFLPENNPLRMLAADSARGLVDICEERVYKVEYRLRDYHDNSSVYTLYIKGKPVAVEAPAQRGCYLQWFFANEMVGEEHSLVVPRAALFEDAWVDVKCIEGTGGVPVCVFGDKKIPLWRNATLRMKIPSHLLPFSDKCYIERVAPKGGSSVGGKSVGGFVTAQIGVLDSYTVAVDTVPPVIKPVAEKTWAKKGKVVLSLADRGTGLENYKCYIDDCFVLFEYSSKNKRLECNLKRERVARGAHTLRVEARDGVGNITVFEKKFKY